MAEAITIENLRAMAHRAGLTLSDDELNSLLSGVNRSKQQVAELRALITRESEPAATVRPAEPPLK